MLRATVSNENRAVPDALGEGGYGLVGMRERARLYGGTVTACLRADGHYTVELIVLLS